MRCSVHTHTHACSHTYTVCTYIITGGGASLSLRIAGCYCNRDDLRGETQQHGRDSVSMSLQSVRRRKELLQPNLSPDQSMRALPR